MLRRPPMLSPSLPKPRPQTLLCSSCPLPPQQPTSNQVAAVSAKGGRLDRLVLGRRGPGQGRLLDHPTASGSALGVSLRFNLLTVHALTRLGSLFEVRILELL